MTVHYLTVEDAIAFHDDQLVRFGGATGIRDEGALASAMFRPQSGYYDDRISEAAAPMGEYGAKPSLRRR